jgi:tRNA threonylcarbamoyladenosine biosynthesis protein TsaB
MLFLTIETCTETSTLGVVRDGVVLAEAAFPSRYTLARRLQLRIDWLLAECELAKTSLDAIAVSQGPGSFTGVRIGAAAAKSMAYWLHIPLVAVPTLEALAYPFRHIPEALLVPLINARRQQAYLALFRAEQGALHRLTPDLLLSAGPFAELLQAQAPRNGPLLCIGQTDGLPAAFLQDAPRPPAPVRGLVTPHALAALAQARLERGEQDDPLTLAPIYLRSAAD